MEFGKDNEWLAKYEPPDWATSLKNIPTHRAKLAVLNTPIHKWKIPDIPQDFSISIKRDDLTGSTLSGNKVRKLEFLLADALNKGCQHIITTGIIQSNHCRATAIAARQLNLQTHLLLKGSVQNKEEMPCAGNVLLDRIVGAKLYITKQSQTGEIQHKMEKLAEMIRDSKHEFSYIVPMGGSNSVGVYGYINCFKEMIDQGLLDQFDDIVCPVGSGGTAAGLAVGNYLTGSKLKCHALAISDSAEHFHTEIDAMLNGVGLDAKSEDIIDIIEGYIGKGYALSSDDELDFILKISTQSGIVLDPVYTGKSVLGLVEELKSNPQRFKGKRILFVHTGEKFIFSIANEVHAS